MPGRLEIDIRSKLVTAASGGTVEVLRDLRLGLHGGSVGAIVGPSGCGKTTMLRIAAGLDRHFDGVVRWPGEGADDRSGRERQRLGMVFQEPRLLPWRTVTQNIRLAAPHASDDLVHRLLVALSLDKHATHYPGELSVGLARRVAVARAFAVEPDVLLLDEPFVSLDGALAAQLRRELMVLVAARPVTVLLVTHDLVEAAELADTIFVLTPRPATVAAEIAVGIPREARDDAAIARIVARIREGGAGRSTPE